MSALVRKKKYGPQQTIQATKSWGTWSLAAVASFAIFLLRLQATLIPTALIVEYVTILAASAFALGYLSTKSKSVARGSPLNAPRKDIAKYLPIVGGLLVITPWVHSFVQRNVLGGSGEATELVWLAMLQTAALWQSAIAKTDRQDWISFLLSCFLMLFGVATSDRAGMIFIVVPFGLMAAWWLLNQYWQSVARGFVAKSTVPLVRLRIGIMALLVGATCLLGLVAWNSGGVIGSLDGFMPTSGGKGGSDPAARQGVGDGDMLVAAKDQAYSFGPVESDLFLDSQSPSLYDLATEVYGEPTPIKRQFSRAVAIDQETKVGKDQGIESKKKGKEFSAMRTPREQATGSVPKSTSSNAVYHVIGHTPLHLTQQCFDHFDGIRWTQSDELDLHPYLVTPSRDAISDKPWMKVAKHSLQLTWSVLDRITLKVINLKTNRVATPPLVTHIYIDKIDQPDFYRWSAQGQLLMPGQPYIPQLTVLHQMYQVPCLYPLRNPSSEMSIIQEVSAPDLASAKLSNRWTANYLQLPPQLPDLNLATKTLLEKHDPRLQQQWTAWQKIEAMVGEMRNSFTVDPKNVPSENADEVISHVLHSKRAPDYLIATTSCMLIRNMGVPCRLVNGFYANPNRYDLKSSMTEIWPEDLHTWVEVYCHGSWIPIEPCRGFAKPREHRNWSQWATMQWWSWRDWVRFHPALFAFYVSVLCIALIARKRIVNGLASAISLVSLPLSGEAGVAQCLWLLRFRRWVFGDRLPERWTLGQWLTSDLQSLSSLTVEDRNAFLGYAQRRAYASADSRKRFLDLHRSSVQRTNQHIILQGLKDLYRLGKL